MPILYAFFFSLWEYVRKWPSFKSSPPKTTYLIFIYNFYDRWVSFNFVFIWHAFWFILVFHLLYFMFLLFHIHFLWTMTWRYWGRRFNKSVINLLPDEHHHLSYDAPLTSMDLLEALTSQLYSGVPRLMC